MFDQSMGHAMCRVAILWLAVVWVLGLCVHVHAQSAVGVPPALSVHGRVVDADGVPVADVRVVLREWSNTRYNENAFDLNVQDVLAETTTDAAGEFEFQNIPSRSFKQELYGRKPWDVVAIGDGFGLAWAHLTDTIMPRPVTLALGNERTVAGQFVRPDDEPIVGAEVALYGMDPPSSDWRGDDTDPLRIDLAHSEITPKATTDADGRFELKGLPPGCRASASVTHPHFATDFIFLGTTDRPQSEIKMPTGSGPESRPVLVNGFSHQLQRGGQIEGTVVAAADDRPINASQITLISDSQHRMATTDPNGRFQLSGLSEGEYQVRVQAPEDSDLLHARTTATIGEDRWEQSVWVSLGTGTAVRGAVVDEETGDGVGGVTVTYIPSEADAEQGWSPAKPATTTDDGRFEIAVPAGPGVLRVGGSTKEHPTHDVPNFWRWRQIEDPPSNWSATVDVAEGTTTDEVRLAVGRGLVVRGRAVDADGQPLANVAIVAHGQYRLPDRERRTTTDADGRFTISGAVASSELNLSLVTADESLRASASVAADESATYGRVVDLEDVVLNPTGSITGLVLADGAPLAGASVSLSMVTSKSNDGGFSSTNVDEATTDESGKYRFSGIEADREIYLRVNHASYTDAGSRGYFKVAAGEQFEHEPMEIQPRVAFVSGTVIDPDGNPVEHATVSVSRRGGGSISGAWQREPTGPDGRFRIDGLPNESLQVMAYIRAPEGTKDHSIHFPAYVDAEPGDDNVRIVLDPKLQRPLP